MRKSFLKWAGGKTQSLKIILAEVYCDIEFLEAQKISKFVEPFVGSGVVFLNVEAEEYIINDINSDLINVYNTLKSDGEYYIKEAKNVFSKAVDETSFYELRETFNESKDAFEKAILFLYLNKLCFNGLCRYNKSGKFNVPYGNPSTIYFPEKQLNSTMIKLERTEIYNKPFQDIFDLIKKGDTIYCDPPYVSLSDISSFTDYSSDGFTNKEQLELAKLAEKSKAKVLISNHDTKFSRKIYKNSNKLTELEIKRFISADGDKRKPVKELLVVYK